jgi:site-specific recombinase XerC
MQNAIITQQEIQYNLSAIWDNKRLSETTKKQYDKAIRNYLSTGDKLDDLVALQSYASDLPKSSRAFLKAAIRIVTNGFILDIKSSATPENISDIQALVYRVEAVNETIQVEQSQGTKANIWLDKEQVTQLMTTCLDDLEGRRDWIVLALLVGAGLRRDELVNLTYSALVTLPSKRNKKRVVLDVIGKGAKKRQIPINPVLVERLRSWKILTGDGRIARAIGRKKEITESLSAFGVFEIVQKHGALIEVPELAPHDLRRTYAQLGYEAGIPITQISRLLGHANVATTQRYLNLELDLDTTISDFIPL